MTFERVLNFIEAVNVLAARHSNGEVDFNTFVAHLDLLIKEYRGRPEPMPGPESNPYDG